MRQRCTLMGFERNYQVGVLSNPINIYKLITPSRAVIQQCKRSLQTNEQMLHPWFITGFIDSEGCFILSLVRNKKLKVGWIVQLLFKIGLHNKDVDLLKKN